MSSLSMSVTPSSKSSRSPASTFSRIAASVSVRSSNAIRLVLPVHDGVGQGLELFAVQLAVQTGTGIACIGERDFPALLDRTGRGDTQQRALELRSTRQRCANSLVTLGSEEEWKGWSSLTQIGAGDLAGLDRHARAVEDVVGDLERDAERETERARAAREPARSLEELPRLQRAALEIRLDRRVGIESLRALHRFTAGEAERRVREDGERLRTSRGRELGEGTREEVVARCSRRLGAMRRPGRRVAAAQGGAVDEVVVHERREVDELDGDAGDDRRLRPGRRREVHEQGPQPLPAGCEGLSTDLRDDAAVGADRVLETVLELAEVGVQPGRLTNLRKCAQTASAVCSATMLPAKRRKRTSRKPAAAISSASSSGPGKRRTLAGRYV